MRGSFKCFVAVVVAGVTLCNAQLLSNRANETPVINKKDLVYDPSRDNVDVGKTEKQKGEEQKAEELQSANAADSSLNANIPSNLKPPKRDEDVAHGVENAACAAITTTQVLTALLTQNIFVPLGKPPCWQ